MSRLFRCLDRLKTVDLSRSSSLTLYCLRNLRQTVESLAIDKCEHPDDDDETNGGDTDERVSVFDLSLSLFIIPRPALKELRMAHIWVKEVSLRWLPHLFPNLVLLDILPGNYSWDFSGNQTDEDETGFKGLSAVAQLAHLQHLYVNMKLDSLSDVSEMVVALTSSNSPCRLQLKTVHINRGYLAPEEMAQLQHLAALEELSRVDACPKFEGASTHFWFLYAASRFDSQWLP